jgi:hypothetical protein
MSQIELYTLCLRTSLFEKRIFHVLQNFGGMPFGIYFVAALSTAGKNSFLLDSRSSFEILTRYELANSATLFGQTKQGCAQQESARTSTSPAARREAMSEA